MQINYSPSSDFKTCRNCTVTSPFLCPPTAAFVPVLLYRESVGTGKKCVRCSSAFAQVAAWSVCVISLCSLSDVPGAQPVWGGHVSSAPAVVWYPWHEHPTLQPTGLPLLQPSTFLGLLQRTFLCVSLLTCMRGHGDRLLAV